MSRGPKPRSSQGGRGSTVRRLERLAWLLDSSIPVPGTSFRIGIDGLIGLVPGVGDAFSGVMSSYILAEAARHGVPKSTLVRMGFNVLVDTLVGMIPLAGDLFDFAWKANNRNVRLLQDHLHDPRRTSTKNRDFAVGLAIVLIAFTVGVIWLGIKVIALVIHALATS